MLFCWSRDLMGFTSAYPNLFGTKGLVVVVYEVNLSCERFNFCISFEYSFNLIIFVLPKIYLNNPSIDQTYHVDVITVYMLLQPKILGSASHSKSAPSSLILGNSSSNGHKPRSLQPHWRFWGVPPTLPPTVFSSSAFSSRPD
ncbi:hypothetical protein VPH35_111593 [Triticum aestivum]